MNTKTVQGGGSVPWLHATPVTLSAIFKNGDMVWVMALHSMRMVVGQVNIYDDYKTHLHFTNHYHH